MRLTSSHRRLDHALLRLLGASPPVNAQSDQPRSISSSTPDGRFASRSTRESQLKRVGQPVTGTVVEPVYAYDRIVIPVGTSVRGHVTQSTADPRSPARARTSAAISPRRARRPAVRHAPARRWPRNADRHGRQRRRSERRTAGRRRSKVRPAGNRRTRPTMTADPQLASRARSEVRQRTNDAMSERSSRSATRCARSSPSEQPGQMGGEGRGCAAAAVSPAVPGQGHSSTTPN